MDHKGTFRKEEKNETLIVQKLYFQKKEMDLFKCTLGQQELEA